MRNAPARTLLAALLLPLSALAADAPSRPAEKGCRWEKRSDAKLGLEAWVQRCDFGFRKIDFVTQGSSLAIRFSDGGAPDPVVDVFALRDGEKPAAGVARVFSERTEKALAARCVIAPWKEGKARPGVSRFTFVPNAGYAKELARAASPDEVGDPPCGPFGAGPDGIQYFEAQDGASRFLFVRWGQEEPLFDEQTLRVLPAR